MAVVNSVKNLARRNSYIRFLLWPLIRLVRHRKARQAAKIDRAIDMIMGSVEEGSLVVPITQFGGSFEVDVNSPTLRRALTGRIDDADRVALAARHVVRDRDVLDIGANIGLYSVRFARELSGGRTLLAVEPTPRAAAYLRRNIERNGCASSVTVYEGVATDSRGSFSINVIPGKEQYSSLGELVHPSIRNERHIVVDVEGDTIDNLVEKYGLQPGFIKVDTEGAEYRVFRGAVSTLTRYHPVLWFELSDPLLASFGHSSEMVTGFLEDLGYRLEDALFPRRPMTEPFDGEVLAVPRDKAP